MKDSIGSAITGSSFKGPADKMAGGYLMERATYSVMANNEIIATESPTAAIESERVAHEVQMKNLCNKTRYKLRKNFKSLVLKIETAEGNDRQALLLNCTMFLKLNPRHREGLLKLSSDRPTCHLGLTGL